jgi:O-antigen/teichoic acid export membrane protein
LPSEHDLGKLYSLIFSYILETLKSWLFMNRFGVNWSGTLQFTVPWCLTYLFERAHLKTNKYVYIYKHYRLFNETWTYCKWWLQVFWSKYSYQHFFLFSACIVLWVFLGLCTKLRDATVSFVVSVSLHGTPQISQNRFWLNLTSEFFPKIYLEDSLFIKIWQE